jgi:hypothetical protein
MRAIIASVGVLVLANESLGAVTVYYTPQNFDVGRQAWMTDMGSHATIDFTGFPANTIITTQYQSLGVTFTDGTDRIFASPNAFPNDGWGLNGAFDEIHLGFNQPMYGLGVDFPGIVKFRLYWQGALIYTSTDFIFGDIGSFAGLISDQPFDAALINDPTGGVFIDDLFFGPPVPAPSAVSLILLAGAARGRRGRARRP